MTPGAAQTPQVPGAWAWIYFLEGHLNHHHHAAYSSPLLSSSCFFFCLFFKICILPLQSHLGFFREINLCLSVTRQNYFFSVCCLSTVKHFTSTCFYQQQWQKKPTKQQREEEMRQKSPSCKCQGLPVEPTERWPCRSCQGLTRTLEWFGLERLKLVSFQPSTKPGLKSYLNLALSRLSPWLAVEFAVLYF